VLFKFFFWNKISINTPLFQNFQARQLHPIEGCCALGVTDGGRKTHMMRLSWLRHAVDHRCRSVSIIQHYPSSLPCWKPISICLFLLRFLHPRNRSLLIVYLEKSLGFIFSTPITRESSVLIFISIHLDYNSTWEEVN
jgi:hypothetical protein